MNPSKKTKPGSYRDRVVWQKAIVLAKLINRLTEEFPVGLIEELLRILDALGRKLDLTLD